MKYKSKYTEDVIESMSDRINISGASPQQIVRDGKAAQRAVAESNTWLIARQNSRGEDTRDWLTQKGFTDIEISDDLFYTVSPPAGWSKETEGYWTSIKDGANQEVTLQFFKGAFYDRCAHIFTD